MREHLSAYDAIDAAQLRRHLAVFLEEVVPVAERLGVRLSCHPDDPPFPLPGLPRIMSTEDDYRWLVDAVDSPANAIFPHPSPAPPMIQQGMVRVSSISAPAGSTGRMLRNTPTPSLDWSVAIGALRG